MLIFIIFLEESTIKALLAAAVPAVIPSKDDKLLSIEEVKVVPLTVKLVDTKLVAVNEFNPLVKLLDAFNTSAFDGNAVPPVTPAV